MSTCRLVETAADLHRNGRGQLQSGSGIAQGRSATFLLAGSRI